MSAPENVETLFDLTIEPHPADPGAWHWKILARADGSVQREGPLAYPTEGEARSAGEHALEKHARQHLLGLVDDWT